MRSQFSKRKVISLPSIAVDIWSCPTVVRWVCLATEVWPCWLPVFQSWVSILICLQCDTVGWAKEGHPACKRPKCWWWSDWSFAYTRVPLCTTTISVTLNNNNINDNTDDDTLAAKKSSMVSNSGTCYLSCPWILAVNEDYHTDCCYYYYSYYYFLASVFVFPIL